MNNNSEVARLLRHIDEQYEAAERGLHGMAITARHDFIAARTQTIAEYTLQIARLVDPEEARTLLLTQDTQNETKEEQA